MGALQTKLRNNGCRGEVLQVWWVDVRKREKRPGRRPVLFCARLLSQNVRLRRARARAGGKWGSRGRAAQEGTSAPSLFIAVNVAKNEFKELYDDVCSFMV
eukprot:3258934-Pyramimonas_sp.AAC.1